ncbi:MAG: phosphate ABC transporter permease subunit PstC [Phycisphaerales bacterium]|nr:phosphate ABC transporter permease subunit PstC [Phycisphaerales bacterium]
MASVATPTSATVVSATLRPRNRRLIRLRDRCVVGGLFGAGIFSILITVAIVFILFGETLRFFGMPEVSLWSYLTGLEWKPLLGADKKFGMWPLVTGTLMVTAIAALVALPIGLITAIYLSEFAPARVRAVIKPALEILAGIPTVVYGFFALTTITPALRGIVELSTRWMTPAGEPGYSVFEFFNSTSAGIAVGIMCLPTVCSLSEDALRAVPKGLREAAFGVGGTRFDVAVKVVTPAALSGIVAAFLLAISRAVGETMIVSLAAGGMARLATDPAEGAQTMTAYMVQIFLGDAEFGSVEYYSSYAIGATLFLMTLGLTLLGNWVLARYREAYE